MGPTQSLPIRAACTVGATVSFSVHAFAKAVPTETAEDYASRIGAAIETALDSTARDIAGGRVRFRLNEMQLLQDAGEADAHHYFAVVSARVIA